MIGIVSYGAYIPRYRLLAGEIDRTWGKPVVQTKGAKAVPAMDEDTVTIAIEAATQALAVKNQKIPIEALFVGSESHPYAVNPTSSIVGDVLGLEASYLALDTEFACKAATSGMQAVAGMIASKQIRSGMVIGADTAQSKPHDALEYTAAAAGASILLGSSSVIASLETMVSYTSDTPDFWRRDGMRYPAHASRFTGEPAYFAHVEAATRLLLKKAHRDSSEITHCVFHMPNAKFPRLVAQRLGFQAKQLAASLTVDAIGNPYSASSLLGLSSVLDGAKPGDTISLVSYGSGAGSDGFLFTVRPAIVALQRARRRLKITVSEVIRNGQDISYTDYLRFTHSL